METLPPPPPPPSNNSTLLLHSLPDPCCFGEDPLFLTYLRLTIHTLISSLQRTSTCDHVIPLTTGIGRPVSRAMIVGIVVRVDFKPLITTYTLDDGTGLLDVILWNDNAMNGMVWDNSPAQSTIDVEKGIYVRAFGRLDFPPFMAKSGRQFMERRQLVLDEPLQKINQFSHVIAHFGKSRELWKSLYADISWKPRVLISIRDTSSAPTSPPPPIPLPLTSTNDKTNKKLDTTNSAITTLESVIVSIIQLNSTTTTTTTTTRNTNFHPLLSPTHAKHVEPEFLSTTFDISTLITHPNIITFCGANITSSELYDQTEKACRSLVRNGKLFFRESEKCDVLQFITHDTCLKPAILAILSKFELENQFVANGMSYPELKKTLQQDVRLRAVSEKTIKESVRLLLKSSLIYEAEQGMLKIIKS
jgi:hypothetical protein